MNQIIIGKLFCESGFFSRTQNRYQVDSSGKKREGKKKERKKERGDSMYIQCCTGSVETRGGQAG